MEEHIKYNPQQRRLAFDELDATRSDSSKQQWEVSIIRRAKKRKRPFGKDNPPKALYRGDDYYRGGPIGRPIDHQDGLPLDDEANLDKYDSDEQRDAARLAMNQQRAREVESHLTPGRKGGIDKTDRYTSFKWVRKGIAGLYAREHQIIKVAMNVLLELQANGEIKILWPEDVAELIRQSYPATKKKVRILANNLQNGMRARQEVLIEGQIPSKYIKPS
ncbi:MAG: hypothetical protein ACPGWR_09835 [Ardenticatenaceae bacterium]